MARRRFTTLAVFAIAVASLAGCGSSSKGPPASPGGTSPTTTPATSSNGGGGYGY